MTIICIAQKGNWECVMYVCVCVQKIQGGVLVMSEYV